MKECNPGGSSLGGGSGDFQGLCHGRGALQGECIQQSRGVEGGLRPAPGRKQGVVMGQQRGRWDEARRVAWGQHRHGLVCQEVKGFNLQCASHAKPLRGLQQ